MISIYAYSISSINHHTCPPIVRFHTVRSIYAIHLSHIGGREAERIQARFKESHGVLRIRIGIKSTFGEWDLLYVIS